MAGKNTRDVELRIAASTSGDELIRKLAKEVQELAKAGGEVTPELKQLAEQLDQLSAQTDAVTNLNNAQQTLTELSDQFKVANDRAKTLTAALNEQSATVKSFADKQTEAKNALRETRARIRQVEAGLTTLNAQYDRAGKATVGYKDKARELKQELAALKNSAAEQRDSVRTLGEAAANAGQGLNKLVRDAKRAAGEAETLAAGVLQQTAAVNRAQQAAIALDIALVGVESTETQLFNAISKTVAGIDEQTAALTNQQAIAAAVGRANERNVEIARRAAAARAADARAAAAAAREQEAAALRLSLAEQEVEGRARDVAAAAKAADEALQGAFGTAGVRSAEVIRNEITQINNALRLMATSGRVTGDEFNRAFASAKTRVAALERELAGIPPALEQTNVLTGTLRQSFSQLTAAFGAFEIGRAFITATNQFETLRRTLALITGSTSGASEQIEFLRKTADNAGLSVGALSQDFVNFTASANTSGISLEKQRDIFQAVANAAGQLGLSTDRVGLILQALSQTANKGKVSLEELQGQLGESLPGALSVVANGFGVTKDRLLDMVKVGIDANSFFDAFIAGSRTAFGQTEGQVTSFAAAVNRLRNAFFEFSSRVADTSGFKALVSVIDATARNFDTLATAATAAAKAFVAFKAVEYVKNFIEMRAAISRANVELEQQTVVTKVATAAKVQDTAATVANTAAVNANTAANNANKLSMGTMANVAIGLSTATTNAATSVGTLSRVTGVLGGAFGALRTAGSALLGIVGGLPGVLALVALNARELGTAIGEGIASMTSWGERTRKAEQALQEEARAAEASAQAKKQLALQTKLAEQASLGLTGQSSKLVDEFNRVAKETGSTSEALEKLAKDLRFDNLAGVEAAGRALNALGVTGKLSAEQIKSAYADALKGEDLLRFETNARAAFEGIKGGAEQLRLVLRAISEESLKRVGSSVQEVQTGFSTAMGSAINDTQALSASLKTLGADAQTTGTLLSRSLNKEIEAASTRKALDEVVARIKVFGETGQLAGVQFEDTMRKAIAKSIEFANTEKDLKKVEDAIKAIIAANPQMAVAFQTSLDQVKQKISEVNPALRQLADDAKRLGVTLADSTNAGISASIAAYERLKASGKVTSDQLQQAFVKVANEAIKAANGQVPEWVKVEAAVRNVNLTVDQFGKGVASAAEQGVQALQRVENAANAAATAIGQVRQVGESSDPFGPKPVTNAQGEVLPGITQRTVMSSDVGALQSLLLKDQAGTLSANDLQLAQTAYETALSNQQSLGAMNPAFVSPEAFSSANADVANAKRILDRLRNASAGRSTANGTSGFANYSVKIEIGGRISTVNTASQADAQALVNTLRTLGSAASRSST